MTMGPAPMMRILFMSLRLGINYMLKIKNISAKNANERKMFKSDLQNRTSIQPVLFPVLAYRISVANLPDIPLPSDNSSPEGTISNESDSQPIVVDLFSFGEKGNREINNAIYRFELEETANDSGTFTGTVEYAITNQVNVIDADFISTLQTIDEDVKFLVSGDLLDEDGATISYSCLLYTSPSPRDGLLSRMPSSA